MKKILGSLMASAGLAMLAVCNTASAQVVKPKPPMYSFQTIWTMPRTQWLEMEKTLAQNHQVLDRAVANGTLTAYGNDTNPFHTADGWTHVNWWFGKSLAAVWKVRDELYPADAALSPVLAAATKQADGIYVSRYYNWRPGSYQGLYTHIRIYTLKANAAPDLVDTLGKADLAPVLERFVADGTLVEYEIDVDVLQKAPPKMFFISYMAEHPEALEKVDAALTNVLKAQSMIDFSTYRDVLSRTTHVVYR